MEGSAVEKEKSTRHSCLKNGVHTHESVHATDSQSRGFQNPTLSSDLIEKKPRAMELRYYKELDKLKKR